MTIARVDEANQDGAVEGEPETRQAWSRRALLDAAGGGFALAASGLLVPVWLEEAEAANHPARRVQHRKDQRRHKHRRQRQHHRRQRRHSPGSGRRNPPGAFIKGIKLTVVSENKDSHCFGSFYDGTVGWDRRQSFDVPLHGSATYSTAKLHAGALFRPLGDGPFVWAENPPTFPPNVNVEIGGELTPNDYIHGSFALGHEYLKEGQETSVLVPEWTGAPQKIRLTFRRENDTDDYKVYTLTVGPA